MRKMISLLAASAALAFATPASAAQVLVDLTNIPAQVSTPSSSLDSTQSFTATSTSTVLTIAGFDVPGSLVLANILLADTTAPTVNVLGELFAYTPATDSPLADQNNTGIYGTRNVRFAGGSNTSYDIFTQTFNTTIGSTYNLSYLFTDQACRGCSAVPNGLRITVGEPTVAGAVPEPATWVMMLLGFGGIGFALRRQRNQVLRIA
jgi:hypothetical protein